MATADGSSQYAEANITKILALLQAKDDTQRFVGLALLKAVLDNSQELREDKETVQSLWASISSKFLDGLLLTGSNPSNNNAKQMLDLVVSIFHTFAVLLPEEAATERKFISRIPRLVDAVLHSSGDTTTLLLQTLLTLVSSEKGARRLVKVDDLSPLTDIAPSHKMAMDILRYAWLNTMTVVEDEEILKQQIDTTIRSLVSSFKKTDAVTLLGFLGDFLREADPAILPSMSTWQNAVVGFINNLVTSRPSPEARYSYTVAAASLLRAYPSSSMPQLLFTDAKKDDKGSAFLLINLLLIDIRSSAPVLLEQLNAPEYSRTSRRLASSFDVICDFIGHLVRSLEDDTLESLTMSPDSLLKLRKSMSETMSVTIEYLRDRWDASVAGAMGLHLDARRGTSETAFGSRHTLAWDSIKDTVDEDPLIQSALRALALWLREDDNDLLQKEATGLMDMFMELYNSNVREKLDFRFTILVALDPLILIDQGRELLLANDGWRILSKDMTCILEQSSSVLPEGEASRGLEIVRILLALTELESDDTPEEWMSLITSVAAWHVPEGEQHPLVEEFQVSVLTLCSSLVANAGSGMLRRYPHSISAIRGIAKQLRETMRHDDAQEEALQDVTDTLQSVQLRT